MKAGEPTSPGQPNTSGGVKSKSSLGNWSNLCLTSSPPYSPSLRAALGSSSECSGKKGSTGRRPAITLAITLHPVIQRNLAIGYWLWLFVTPYKSTKNQLIEEVVVIATSECRTLSLCRSHTVLFGLSKQLNLNRKQGH